MRIIVLALALLPAAAMARDGDKPVAAAAAAPALCQDAKTRFVAAPAPDARPSTLERQPVANRYLGVLRFRDGCDRPVMARHGLDQGVDARP